MPVPGFSKLTPGAKPGTPAAAANAVAAKPPMTSAPMRPAAAPLTRADIQTIAPTTAIPVSAAKQAAAKAAADLAKATAAAKAAEEAAALEVVEPTVNDVIVAEAEPIDNVLIGFGETANALATDSANGLAAFMAEDSKGGAVSLFPVMQLTGGDSGGLFKSPDWQDDDLKAVLPQGDVPVHCVFMGYRIDLIAWPADKDEMDRTNPGGRPAWSAAVASSNAQAMALVAKATKRFQFTPKVKKQVFSIREDGQGPGHLRPSIELLVYLPPLATGWEGGLVVLKTPSQYGSVVATLAQIGRLVDPATNQPRVQPVVVRIPKPEIANAATAFKIWSFEVTPDSTKGAQTAQGYVPWYQAAREDDSYVTKVNDWLSGADRQLTEDHIARLQMALVV